MTLEHGSINIGRSRDNEIHLNDETLSGRHARIVTIFTASHIEDLDSTNGTFVNDKKVLKHTLHDGDVITVGQCHIEFISDVSNKNIPSNDAQEKTMMMSDEKLKSMLAEAAADQPSNPSAGVSVFSAVEPTHSDQKEPEEALNKPEAPLVHEDHETQFNPVQANASIYQPEDGPGVFEQDENNKSRKNSFVIGAVAVVAIAAVAIYAIKWI